MLAVAFWLAQNLLAVLTAAALQTPEVFLLHLIFRLLTEERDAYVPIIWTAFVGGLLWDLRWVGVPGFFALSYVLVVLATIGVWNTLPVSGRTLSVSFVLPMLGQVFPALLYVLFLGRGAEGERWVLFGIQQACTVPLVLLGVFFCARRLKDQNV